MRAPDFNPSAAPDVEYAITLMGCWARDEKPCGPAGAAKLALTSLEYLKGEIERLTRERNEAREHTSTAAFMRVEAERDEWAEKWHRLRAELAELKYPGMKGVVRPLSGEPESAHETCEERCRSGLGHQGEFLWETQCTLREGHAGSHQYASDPRPPVRTEEQVVDAIRQAIGELHKDDRERVFAIADRFRDEIRRDQLAGMAFALVGAELAAQP